MGALHHARLPRRVLPRGYNNAYEFIQTPGYVVIVFEMIHETRIIPIDGRPKLGANIKQWNGEPRGRWEGNTLVVESTNYNNKGSIGTAPPPAVCAASRRARR